MQYKNLDFMTETILGSLILVLLAGVFIRAGVFAYRAVMRIPRLYPAGWTATQCRTMDRFGLGIGMMLVVFWATQHFAVPLMPTNWPFGFLEAISIIVLLFLTNAWVILVLPHDWRRLWGPLSRFAVTMAVLAAWWAVMFAGTALMLAASTRPPLSVPIAGPVVA
jgi:hypothetical protein